MPFPKVIAYCCLFFVGGIFFSPAIHFSQNILFGFLFLGLVSSFIFRKKKIIIYTVFLLAFFSGVWRCQLAEKEVLESQLNYLNGIGEVVFTGVVDKEADVREKSMKLTINEVEVDSQKIEGKILVTVGKYPRYEYGDKLRIKGTLEFPEEFPDFNYKEYLIKDGVYSVSYYPDIELLGENQGNFVLSGILHLKEKLREVIFKNLSPPQSSILVAIILGDQRQISDLWKEKLNLTGVRHLTAVSGMNVTLISAISMSFLLGLGFWRKQAFWITIIFISIFVIMTGLQSSAVRAGIMGVIFLLAQYLGRSSDSSRAILIAATLMLILNPFLLRLDVGFQLSFLAMLGIIYLLPIFQAVLNKIPNVFQLRNMVAMTLSAQIFTLPILIYNFGYFSLVSPIVNILAVPFSSAIMVFGFIFAFLGLVWQPLGWVFSFPSWFLLSYLTGLVDWFSKFSFSAVFLEVSGWWPALLYLVLGLLLWRFRRKTELNFLGY